MLRGVEVKITFAEVDCLPTPRFPSVASFTALCVAMLHEKLKQLQAPVYLTEGNELQCHQGTLFSWRDDVGRYYACRWEGKDE